MLVPRVRVVRCAPKTHPCPHCGRPGPRQRTLHRRIRSLAYRHEAYLDVYYAEYKARCQCRKFFRSWPLDVPPKSDYDPAVRQAVLDRLLEDGLNVERTLAGMERDFGLKLSHGFVYDCLRGGSPGSTWHHIAGWSWRSSPERCASTSSTSDASPSCWPPTRSPTCRSPSPSSVATTRPTCAAS